MTVQTSSNVATGIGNGVTTVFPVGYKFNEESDLVVLRIDDATSAAETLTLNSDYTVQGAGNEAGGSVTMAAPLAVGKTLTITRIVDILQLTDLRNQGKFFAEVHEDSFDKFIMIMQQLFQAVGDSLQLNAARNRWDAKGRRIINVGDPVDAQDAVTKSWLEAYITALLQTSVGPVQTAASVIIVAPNGDVFTLQDLANTTDPAKGAAIVGYKGRDVAERLSDFISVKDFAAIGDGVVDDSPAFQSAINYCATNNKVLYIPAGIYYIPTTILLDQVAAASYEVVGAGCGDAYWEEIISDGTSASVIKTNGNDVFSMGTPYPTSSVIISKLKLLGVEALKTGFLLNLTGITSQLKNLYIDYVCGSYCGGLLKAYSVDAINLPYTTMTKCYTWSTDKVVYLDNVPATIFTIRDSLFHGTVNYAIHLGRGADLSISDTWFESGIPASIYKPSSDFLNLSLHNVYFETASAPANPSFTTIVAAANSAICLSGKTNLPGAFMTNNPFVLNSLCTLANYTSQTIIIRSMGGVVLTPETVRLHPRFSHQVHVPTQSVNPEAYGDTLYKKSVAGPLLGDVNYNSPAPEYMLNLAQASSLDLCRGDFSVSPVYTDDRLVCAAFAYESANVDNGIGVGSSISVDGVAIGLNSAYLFPNALNRSNYYCIVAVPLPAGSSPTSSYISIRNSKWHSLANVMVPKPGATISQSMALPLRRKTERQSILAGGSYVFNFQCRFGGTYLVSADLVVNNGSKGFYKIKSSGIATNGSKNRVIENNITDPSVVVSAADGAHVDILSVTVTNNTAGIIDVNFSVSF